MDFVNSKTFSQSLKGENDEIKLTNSNQNKNKSDIENENSRLEIASINNDKCSHSCDINNNNNNKSENFDLNNRLLTDKFRESSKFTYFIEKPHKNLFCPSCFNLYNDPVLIDCSHTLCNSCITVSSSKAPSLSQIATNSSNNNNNINNNNAFFPSLNKCPLDGQICSIKLKNRNIAEQIDDLMIRCRYGVIINSNNLYSTSVSLPMSSMPSNILSSSLNSNSKTVCSSSSNQSAQEVSLALDLNGCQLNIKYGSRQDHEAKCLYRPVKCPNSEKCLNLKAKDLDEHLKVCTEAECPYLKYGCSFIGTKAQVEDHLKSCKYDNIKELIVYKDSFEENFNKLNQSLLDTQLVVKDLTSCQTETKSKIESLEKTLTERLDTIQVNQDALWNQFNKHFENLANQMNDLKIQIINISTEIDRKSRASDPVQLDNYHQQQTTVKCIGTFVGHSGSVSCCISYNELLISGSLDGTIKVWDATSKFVCLKTLEAHIGGVRLMTEKNSILYSIGEADKKIISWNLESYAKIMDKKIDNQAHSLVATDDFKLIIGCVEVIKIYNSKNLDIIKEIIDEGSLVCALNFYDKYLISGSIKSLKVWNSEDFSLIHKVSVPGRMIYAIVVYTNYIFIANDNSIYVYDSKNYQLISKLHGHCEQITDLVVAKSNLGDKLFSASRDRTLRVWSLEFLICSQVLHRHQGYINSLTSIRNTVFSASTDQQIKMWQINAFGLNIPNKF